MNKKLLFTSFLSVFILSMFSKLAAAAGAAASGVSGAELTRLTLMTLAQGLGALFRGDFQGFFNGIFAAVPLIGVFLAIYGLIWFVGTISIFRKSEHSKFAHMFAIGVALAVIFQGSVFGTLMNMSSMFLTFITIIAFVFMGAIFWRHLRTEHLKKGAEQWDAKNQSNEAKYAAKKSEIAMRKDLYGVETAVGATVKKARKAWNEIRDSENDTTKELAINAQLEKLDANDKNIETLINNQTGTLTSLDSTLEKLAQNLEQLANNPSASNEAVMDELRSLSNYLKKADDLVDPILKELKELFSNFITESKEDRIQSKETHDALIKQLDLARTSSDERVKSTAKEISDQLNKISKDIKLINVDDSVIEKDLDNEINQLKLFDKNLKAIANNLQIYAKSHSETDLKTIFNQIINLKQELASFRGLEQDVANRSNQIFNLRRQLMALLARVNQEEKTEEKDEEQDIKEDKTLYMSFKHEIISLKAHVGTTRFESELLDLRNKIASAKLSESEKANIEKSLSFAINLDKKTRESSTSSG